jgi:hypothetical protein
MVQSQRSWLVAEHLPPYAPDLTPSRRCGPTSSAKSSLTLATDDLGEVMAAAHRGDRTDPLRVVVAYAFARRCGIYFW